MSSKLASAAGEYGDQGIAVMPCVENGKKPALSRTGKEHSIAVHDNDQIQQWWTKDPRYNIGIACTPNRLAVIDIDGEAGVTWIHENALPMPQTWTAITGRGHHYYYRWPPGLQIRTCQIAPKLEIRAAGAYVIAPPSIHPNGDIYQWATKHGTWEDLPELPPEWISLQPPLVDSTVENRFLDNVKTLKSLTITNTVALKRLDGLSEHLATTEKGSRHQALYTIARTLGQLVASQHLTRGQISVALHAAAERNALLAEDGTHNITQTINDGISKGVEDGPDTGHHETAERNLYILPPPGEGDPALTEPGKQKVDLIKLMTTEFDDDDWLIEPIIPAKRSVALYAAGKTGKSLLVLDFVAAAASGRPILGGAPLETPINVLYVDQEMTQPDLQERLYSLGYDQDKGTLETLAQHLHYYQLYPWLSLDTRPGGQELLDEALNVGAQLVVIDTLIRTVEGEENSADTIKNFNRYTAMRLKEHGIALLRIDHAGKDLTRGQRGTSAKRDDVDVVWLLMSASGDLPGKTMLTLRRDAARVDWVQQDVDITRNEGPPLTHTVPIFSELSIADTEIVTYLEEQGLARHNVTIRSARQVLSHSTLTAKATRLAHIVKWIKQYGDTQGHLKLEETTGNRGGNRKKNYEGNHEGNHEAEKGTAQVRDGNRQGTATKKRNQDKGIIDPPLRGGSIPSPHSDEEQKEDDLPIPW